MGPDEDNKIKPALHCRPNEAEETTSRQIGPWPVTRRDIAVTAVLFAGSLASFGISIISSTSPVVPLLPDTPMPKPVGPGSTVIGLILIVATGANIVLTWQRWVRRLTADLEARLAALTAQATFFPVQDSKAPAFFAKCLDYSDKPLAAARSLYDLVSQVLEPQLANAFVQAITTEITVRESSDRTRRSEFLEYDLQSHVSFEIPRKVEKVENKEVEIPVVFGPAVQLRIVQTFLAPPNREEPKRPVGTELPGPLSTGPFLLNVVVSGPDWPPAGSTLGVFLGSVTVHAYLQPSGKSEDLLARYVPKIEGDWLASYEPNAKRRLTAGAYVLRLEIRNVPHCIESRAFTFAAATVCAGPCRIDVKVKEPAPVKFASWSRHPLLAPPLLQIQDESDETDEPKWPTRCKVLLNGSAEFPVLPWEGITVNWRRASEVDGRSLHSPGETAEPLLRGAEPVHAPRG